MLRSKLLVIVGMVVGSVVTATWLAAPSSPAIAQENTPQKTEPATTKDITVDQAYAITVAAIEKAKQINTKMDIAIVDAGGNLKSFVRMDGAWLGSIDIAIKKAKTARYFDMPTGELGKLSQPGGPLYQIEVSNQGLITFPGGVPLKASDGTIIGAIGVSGSTVENDHTVAQAGVDALGAK
jgi:uncharacterized protein GlcG (DUF336 family)